MAKLKIVWVVGMAYSGSSLLNVLLDTQPGIRGIGEGAQVFRKLKSDGPCTRCQSPVANCEMYGPFEGDEFYQFTADEYGDCTIIVDSSKHAKWLIEHAEREPDCDYYAILLSKMPHEAAYSLMQHNKWDTWNPDKRHTSVPICFRSYEQAYRKYIDLLKEFFGGQFEDRVFPLRYRRVAGSRIHTIRRLCTWLETSFDERRLLSGWRDTDTHILGGNPSIIAQVSRNESLSFAIPPTRYLDGKYKRADGRVFVDRQWRTDRPFRRQCVRAYEKNHISEELLCSLGYASKDELITDVANTNVVSQRST